MLFNKRWVDELVPNKLSSEELCDRITMAGLEVDTASAPCGKFEKVVVAKVLECVPHPDSDHMHVTKVDAGTGEILQIVCGAPNVRAGLLTCCALIGGCVGDMKMKPAKLRGVESFGMLCSYKELGMAEESDGIIELPDDAPVGTDVHDYFKLDDTVVDVDLTTNRADCLGIMGIAREVAVLTGQKLKAPEVKLVPASIDDRFEVDVEDKAACPRYLCRVIRNVNQKAKSPLWMTERLRRCGIRAISPIVDVTNYVMLEYSQPMHSFDLGMLKGRIIVRKAREGEKLRVLSGEDLTLKPNTLVVCDSEGPAALAGIFGGEKSGISEDTRDVLLESAFFAPDAIKGRAREYGLDTEAAHRFERGVDHDGQRRALERATQLLLDIAGGQAGPITEAVSEQDIPQHKPIRLRYSKLDRVLGETIDRKAVFDILDRLELSPAADDQGVTCTSPSFRFDIAIEEDLVEEVARIYGYDSIPATSQVAALVMKPQREEDVQDREIKQALVSRGYSEAITYSFTHPDWIKAFNDISPLMLTSPISPELSAMRTTLLPALCEAAKYNLNRQQKRVRLFEQGLRYIKDEHAENGVRQDPMVAGVAAGERYDETWGIRQHGVDFFDMKGDVEQLLSVTADPEAFEFRRTTERALHPGQGADIYKDGVKVGFVGMLHPIAMKQLGLKGKVGVFEIERQAIASRAIPAYKPLSKFPSVRRDFAFVISKDVSVASLLDVVRGKAGALLEDMLVFDVFEDEKLGGARSVALGVVLRDPARTLEDAQVDAIAKSIVEEASGKLGAQLRS
ncbi:MAG: phenylalanine--tRNA ligase subunit beta [Aeromonadales bacterium]|nr:phenylalanine--tRNA ligase subunit beta [Aeromonadales bacterium]MDY2891468.1 phenylalanine--tRNA ligase subunit beta [Succinivibrio sp.]